VTQRPFKHFAAAHEKAAQRVGNIGLADKVRETRRDPAYADAAATPIAETPASHIAAPDYQIDGAALERLQHARQQPLIVLKIGIHYRDVGRARSEHTLYASCCETAPADPFKTAHPRVAPSEGTNMFGDGPSRESSSTNIASHAVSGALPPARRLTVRYSRARSG
jgi:hypothetical protein